MNDYFKSALLIVLSISLYSTILNAQNETNLPTIIPPSPSVSSLMRFEEVPVDHYTGQPSISIPLGNIPMLGGMNYPINLNYNTQGIRVDERSGWLGTGFSMSTGGVISRTVMGVPDEMNSSTAGIGVFHNEYSNYANLNGYERERFLWETQNGTTKYDAEYDIYQYAFMGKSGRFIIKKENGSLVPVIIERETNDKINLFYNSVTFEVTGFQITDTSGYVYTFELSNTNLIYTSTVSTPQYGGTSTQTTDTSGVMNVPNTWYLKNIKSPNGIELCHFNYQNVQEYYNTPVSEIRNRLMYNNIDLGVGEVRDMNKDLLLPSVTSFWQNINSTQKYVSEVVFHDGTTINYILQNGHPEFHNTSAKLKEIQITQPNGQVFKKITFTYQTSNNNRLFLKQIKEIYGNENLEYNLDYNNLNDLPSFGSDRKDSFGYYSEIGRVDTTRVRTGALKSIQYPTGGKKEFTFESNSYSYQGAQLVDKHTIPENRHWQRTEEQVFMNNHNTTNSQKVLVYIDQRQIVDLDYTILTQGNGVIPENHYLSLTKAEPIPGVYIPPIPANGGDINYNDYPISKFQYHSSGFRYTFMDTTGNNNASTHADALGRVIVSPGWYFLELTYYGYVAAEPLILEIQAQLKYTTFKLNSLTKYGGGIRIKKVAFTDRGDIKNETEYIYDDLNNNTGTTISQGDDRVFQPINGVNEITKSSGSYEFDLSNRKYLKGKTHPFVTSALANSVLRTPRDVTYEVTRDINSVLTPTTRGSYVGYQNVYVKKEGLGGELYTFISPKDVQTLTDLNTTYPFVTPENKDYKRGMVKTRGMYDEEGKIIVKEEYNYYDVATEALSAYFLFETQMSDCPWDQFYNSYDDYLDLNIASLTNNSFGNESSVGNCHTNSDMGTDTFTFIKGVLLPKEVKKTEYVYDENNIASETVTVSKSEYNQKNMVSRAMTEFTEGGVTKSLREDLFYPYSVPSSEYTNEEFGVFQEMTDLNQINSPVLSKQYLDEQLINTIKKVYNEFNDNVFAISKIIASKGNFQEQARVLFHDYNIFGLPLEVSKTDGIHHSYVWGYNNMSPIAKLSNVSLSVLTSEQNNAIEEAINHSNLDVDSTSENLLRTKLDNLRAVFPEAMVSTVTYDPLIGPTSEASPNGHYNYYVYNQSHRLKHVKDHENHIISTNEYFYRNTNDLNNNYLKSILFQVPTTTGEVENSIDKIETISYLDGLGRKLQDIAGRAGGQQQDVIIPYQYDDWGRQVKQFLPWVNNGQTSGQSVLSYRNNETVIAALDDYYRHKYPNDFDGVTTDNPFIETLLEASPLGRPLKQGAPGSAWSVEQTGAEDHTLRMVYEFNTNHDEVRLFRVNNPDNIEGISLEEDGIYKIGELYKVITKDENWTSQQMHTTETFTDKFGRKVLIRKYDANGITGRVDTYYVYDDYGNLTYVLSPKASEFNNISAETLKTLAYEYRYDKFNRLIEKKIPGKDWEDIVYDRLDRPILSRDANLKANGQWLFTKYDIFGRVAYSGIYNKESSRLNMQTAVDVHDQLYESRKYTVINGTPIYYTNVAYPSDNRSLEVLNVNYYDDYEIGNQITINPANGSYQWENMEISNATKGLSTISRSKVLGTEDWITSATYYDNIGRPWEAHIKNEFLGTDDWELNKLDFIGKVEKTQSVHSKNGQQPIVTIDYFTYDHANRLLTHRQSINNQEEEVIVSNTYDDLGELENKGIGGKVSQNRLQDITYKYNIRGWLTDINNVDEISNNALFNYRLSYNQQEGAVQYDNLFNGNISQSIWRTASTDPSTGISGQKRAYSYDYDPLNRIKRGIMRKGETLNVYTRHHLRSVSYDKNGNITSLQRDGKSTIVDDLTYNYFGNQLKSVNDSNGEEFAEEGFVDRNTSGNDYAYDANGNMIVDKNKGITSVTYNHLNLPVTVSSQEGKIKYFYDALGTKQRKLVTNIDETIAVTDYAIGHQYQDAKLQFISTPEGYVEPNRLPNGTTEYNYIYQYKDHLDNIRLAYSDTNKDGVITANTEIIEENNYYPFGLKHKGYNNFVNDRDHQYGFGGKEEQNEFNNTLGWMDISARNYDPSIARWMNIDPLAEQMRRHSPYNFAFDNPVFYTDPDGMMPVGSYGQNLEAAAVEWYSSNPDDWDKQKVDSDTKIFIRHKNYQTGEKIFLVIEAGKVDSNMGMHYITDNSKDNLYNVISSLLYRAIPQGELVKHLSPDPNIQEEFIDKHVKNIINKLENSKNLNRLNNESNNNSKDGNDIYHIRLGNFNKADASIYSVNLKVFHYLLGDQNGSAFRREIETFNFGVSKDFGLSKNIKFTLDASYVKALMVNATLYQYRGGALVQFSASRTEIIPKGTNIIGHPNYIIKNHEPTRVKTKIMGSLRSESVYGNIVHE